MPPPKRRVFISFDHDDSEQVNGFLGLRNILDNFEFYNHKLDRRVDSADGNYVGRVIKDEYIRPASVTIVLIGNTTAQSSWVQWEIQESIRQGKGLLGIRLKGTWGAVPAGIPQNAVGGWDPDKFPSWVEWAYQQTQGR
jgi:Thoeris protein ThsB, TIR-like domain